MSDRPAYNLLHSINTRELTEEKARDLITDLGQVKDSLTLGVNVIGELITEASKTIDDRGGAPQLFSKTGSLLTMLAELIQGCDEQASDCEYQLHKIRQRNGVTPAQKQD